MPKNLGAITDAKDLVTREYAEHYGVCSTKSSTAAKEVTVHGVTDLHEGEWILVKFANAQTYNGAPTLNVNGLGAVNIKRIGSTNAARYEWQAGEIILFVFDGTYWVMVDAGWATTSYYGLTKLSTSATSTSTGYALTPASLNSLVQNMIAGVPVYSASETYEVGNMRRYGYQIWVCATAITVPEAWDETHWTSLDSLLDLILARYVKPSGGIPASDLASGIIPSSSSSTPLEDGTASPGTSNSWSRGDHVHPHDTSKQDSVEVIRLL